MQCHCASGSDCIFPLRPCQIRRYFGAEERALEMRYGPEVALVGTCQHPKHPATINSKWDCEDWTAHEQPSLTADAGPE
jgi:hypothetical protein